MILVELTRTNIIIMALLGYIVTIFYFLSGMSLLIHPEQKLFGKNHIYKEPQKLNKTIGIAEIICASCVLVLITLGLIFKAHFMTFLIIAASLTFATILFDVFYPKTKRIK